VSSGAAYAGDDPRHALAHSRALARQVRHAGRATWFPLAVFALVTFGAIPVYRLGSYARTCRGSGPVGPAGPARVCAVYSNTAFVYWPVVLVVSYALIALFYLRRSRARGLASRVGPYVAAGVAIAIVVSAAALWAAHHPPLSTYGVLGLHVGPRRYGLVNRAAGAFAAIGLGLLVLSRIERSVALLAFTVGYLVIVLVPVDFGWTIAHPSIWAFLPRLVVDGSALGLGAAGFALAERRRA
jgi:hypothetical protein